jgi:hypothetical protein
MQHDLEDGLTLAEKAKRTNTQYQSLIYNSDFLLKYPKLMKQIVKKIETYNDALSNIEKEIVREYYNALKLYND